MIYHPFSLNMQTVSRRFTSNNMVKSNRNQIKGD